MGTSRVTTVATLTPGGGGAGGGSFLLHEESARTSSAPATEKCVGFVMFGTTYRPPSRRVVNDPVAQCPIEPDVFLDTADAAMCHRRLQ